MVDQRSVLKTACEAFKQEFKLISRLLSVSPENPLGKEASDSISIMFDNIKKQADTLIGEVEDAILADPKTGWQKYVELRTEVMPILSSELLAVIGGMYLVEKDLDNLRHDERGKSPMNFSSLAKDLVNDIASRSKRLWNSVLIVGEERIGYQEAEIIRLRFPACDIWNLPFTAHEYGYLISQNPLPEKLKELKNRVRNLADPRKHQGIRPPNPLCYLPVLEIWERYYRDSHYIIDEQDLTARINLLEDYLCRLFADAFATFFVGPAYVFALLYLRFLPDDTLYASPSATPPFAHRFVFALETLKWMDGLSDMYKNLGYRVADHETPFANEVDDSVGTFPLLWRQTLADAGLVDQYAQIAKDYQEWLEEVQRALKDAWSGERAGGETYKNWRIVQMHELAEKIRMPKMTVEERPGKWAVLNAAWEARAQAPVGEVAIIEANALRLLDEEDQTVIAAAGAPAPGGARGKKEQKDFNKAEAIKIVQTALAEEYDLLLVFTKMANDPQGYQLVDKILEFLKPNKQAAQAYIDLWKNP